MSVPQVAPTESPLITPAQQIWGDGRPDPVLADLVELAAHISRCPAVLLTLTNGEQRWCQAHHSWPGAEDPYWSMATANRDPCWLEAADLADLQAVAWPSLPETIGFYGGIPLTTAAGTLLGLLSIAAPAAAACSAPQRRGLVILAHQIVEHVELQAYQRICPGMIEPPPDLISPAQGDRDPKASGFYQPIYGGLGFQPAMVTPILESLDNGIAICDLHQQIMIANRAARELLGLPDPLGSAVDWPPQLQLYVPGSRSPLLPEAMPLGRILRGENLQDMELVIAHPDQDRYIVLLSGQPIQGLDGQVCGAVMSFQDITQRYHAEMALRSRNQGLKTVALQRMDDLESMNRLLMRESIQRQQAELALQEHRDYLQIIFDTEPEWVSVITPEGLIQFINPAGLALLEVEDADRVLGTSLEDMVMPAWRSAFRQFHDQVCAGERGILEFELRGHQGTSRWVEIHSAPLKNTATAPFLHLAVGRDMTDRQRAEQALKDSERLFSHVTNMSPALIWMSDVEGLCNYFNEPWLQFTGHTLAEEMGNGWAEGVHADDLDYCLDIYTTAFRVRQPFTMEYRLRRYDGEYRWILDQGQPRYDTNQQFLGYIGSCMDISDRKLAAIQIEKLNRVYATLSAINEAIIHIRDPQQLLETICQIAVTTGGFHMAWIGLLDPDSQTLEPAAAAGKVEDYLQKLKICLTDEERSQGPGGQAMKQGRAIVCNDVATDPTVACWRQEALAMDFRSLVSLPLMVSDTVRGTFTLYATQSDFFNADELSLLEKLALNIGFALDVIDQESQRQRAEILLRESEERFRGTFEQAAVGIAHVALDGSWLRLNQTFCDLIGYSYDELMGKTFHDITYPDDLVQDLSYFHEVLQGNRQSYTLEKRYIHKDHHLIWVNLTVSLVRDGAKQPKYFISVIQDITATKQAADTLQQYAQRIQGLRSMDRAILAKFQPHEIAGSALSQLCRLLTCQQGMVTLFHPLTGKGEVIADNSSEDLIFPTGTHLPITDFVFSHPPQRYSMRRVKDIAQLQDPPLIFQCFLAANVRAAMVMPLVVNEQVIGEVMLADPMIGHFNLGHEEILQEVSDHLAIALQNARLFEQVKADRGRLQVLSSRLLEIQETERRFIAHELHDEIGQALTAMKLNLHKLERLVDVPTASTAVEDCLHLASQVLQQVRNLSLDLRPSMLDDLGLVPALRWYVNRHAERSGLAETFICDDTYPRLSTYLETACFRIVQEALTNIARHAQAQTVTVVLQQSSQELHLTIQDDGIGFDVEAARSSKNQGISLGLLGMEERSMLIGGHITLTSAPGQGTCIDLRAPLRSTE